MLDEVKNAVMLCEAIYAYSSAEIITWDYLSQGKVYWGLKQIDGINYICFRGSTTIPDWFRDANALADPFVHDKLGPLHPGIYDGVPEAYAEIKSKVTENIIFTGHSLGSGETDIVSGLAVIDGINPLAKIGFGPPKVGFKQLAQVVKDIPDFCFRNNNGTYWDLITSVPFTFYPEEYQHTAPLFDICEEPAYNDYWGIFAWHHIQLYKAGIAKLTEEQLINHHNTTTLRKAEYLQPATQGA